MTGRRRRSVSARRQPVAALLSRRHPQGCEQARGGGFRLALPAAEIATIGDQQTDVPMFVRSGLSIAIGNAPDEVKAQAAATTDSYTDEGFAKAMERLILGKK